MEVYLVAPFNKNKSEAYGGYGGVSQRNHYVPPEEPPFIPQPATVHFMKHHLQQMVEQISAVAFEQAKAFVSDNSANIMFRNILIDKGGIKTSVLFTQKHPTDLLTFTARATSSLSNQEISQGSVLTEDTIETENIHLTDNAELTSNKNYFIPCLSEDIELTLPSNPEHQDFININFNKNSFNLIINAGSYFINGGSKRFVVQHTKTFGLIYNHVNTSWEYLDDTSVISDATVMDGGTF